MDLGSDSPAMVGRSPSVSKMTVKLSAETSFRSRVLIVACSASLNLHQRMRDCYTSRTCHAVYLLDLACLKDAMFLSCGLERDSESTRSEIQKAPVR
jgi:hypothetical protein